MFQVPKTAVDLFIKNGIENEGKNSAHVKIATSP